MLAKPTEVAAIDAHGRHAQAVHFTRNGKFLVSAGQDASVRLWSLPGFAAARVALEHSFEGHKNSVNSLSFTLDEKFLATGSSDGTVRIWSFPDGRCLHTLEKQMTGVFSPAGDRLATVAPKGDVTVWDAKSFTQISSIAAPDKRTTAIAFSPGGRSLLIGGMSAIHRVGVTGANVAELKGHKALVSHKAPVTCLRVSPDDKWLASTGADGYLRLWSTKNWEERRAVKLEASGMLQIAFAPSSDSVTVAADHLIQSYSTKDGKPVERIELPVKGVYGIAISPDGAYLANAAADGKVRVWRR